MKNNDIYQQITDRFITAIENGTEPWKCPWDKNNNSFLPVNHTDKNYSGINIMLLWMEQVEKGYQSNQWITYKQAASKNASVKEGEKGTKICFYKPYEIKDKNRTNKNGDYESKTIPLLKTYTVFNCDQIDNLPATKNEITDVSTDKFYPIDKAEQVIKDSKVRFIERGDKAYYSPIKDQITMPDRYRFEDTKEGAESFYATAFHELTHATKHPDRCDRKSYESKVPKGSYAFEELVAEIGAVYTMASLGLTGEKQNHDSYVASWLKVLKEDKKAIFKAASQAQKACNWIKEQSPIFELSKPTNEDIQYPIYPEHYSVEEKFVYYASDGNLEKVTELLNDTTLDLNKTEPNDDFLSIGERAIYAAGLGNTTNFKKGNNKAVVRLLSNLTDDKKIDQYYCQQAKKNVGILKAKNSQDTTKSYINDTNQQAKLLLVQLQTVDTSKNAANDRHYNKSRGRH